jgi:hypothetical protein
MPDELGIHPDLAAVLFQEQQAESGFAMDIIPSLSRLYCQKCQWLLRFRGTESKRGVSYRRSPWTTGRFVLVVGLVGAVNRYRSLPIGFH